MPTKRIVHIKKNDSGQETTTYCGKKINNNEAPKGAEEANCSGCIQNAPAHTLGGRFHSRFTIVEIMETESAICPAGANPDGGGPHPQRRGAPNKFGPSTRQGG